MASVTTTSGNIAFMGTLPSTYSPASACTGIVSEEVVGIDFASTCLPENFDTTAVSAYYTSGWECPDGYFAPSSCHRSASSDATVHTVTCCPSRSNVALTCVDNPESLSSVWSTLFCTWSAGSKEMVFLVTSTSTDSSTSTVITTGVTMSGGAGINAYGIRMIYDDSDLPTSTTNAGTTEVTDTTETTGAGAVETTAADNSDNSDNSDNESGESPGGLSTGGIAAIAVVIPLVTIAALVGLFFWFRRRKQRQQQTTSELHGGDAPKELSPESAPSELYGYVWAPQELDSPHVAVELPANMPNFYDARAVPSPGLSSDGVSKMDATSSFLSTASRDGGHDRTRS